MDLQFLCLNRFDLGNKLGEDGAKYIADVLKVNTTLSNLEIGCESFFVFFFMIFVFFFENLFFFFWFSFLVNRIGDSGVSYFAEALKVNNTLIDLTCLCESGWSFVFISI